MRTLRIGAGIVVLATVLAGTTLARGPDDDVAKIIAILKDPKSGANERAIYYRDLLRYATTSKAVVPFLTESLSDPKSVIEVAMTLQAIGPAARPAAPALMKALRADENLNAEIILFNTLDQIGAEPKDILEPLAALIDDDNIANGTKYSGNYGARCDRALRFLGQMGPAGRDDAPALVSLLNSKEGEKQGKLAQNVLDALLRIDPEAQKVLPTIQPFLQAKNPLTKRTAELAVVRIGKDPALVKREVDLFLAAFRTKQVPPSEKRALALTEFGKLGPVGKDAVPTLLLALENPQFQVDAIRCLGPIGPDAKAAIPALQKLAEDHARWPELIQPILEALEGVDRDGKSRPAILHAVLKEYITNAEKYRALAAGPPHVDFVLQQIRKLGPDAVDYVPELIDLLKNMASGGYSLEKRTLVIQSLGATGSAAKSALPILEAGMNAGRLEPPLVMAAVAAIKPGGLGAVQPGDPARPVVVVRRVYTPEKVKELIAALKDPAPMKRKEAILDLAKAGVIGRTAESALVELLRDPDREVRLLAAYALEKLETAK